MRTKIIFFIAFFIAFFTISLNSFSQVNSKSDFNEFKSYFYKDKTNNIFIEIPMYLCRKILSETVIDTNVVGVSAYKIFEKQDGVTLIIELGYPEGGYSSKYNMFSFSNDGKLNKSKAIGFNALDADGGPRCELKMINDSLLEAKEEVVDSLNNVKEEIKINADGSKETKYKIEYSYYVINGQGFYSVELPEALKGRLYPQASIRIVDLSELKEIHQNELDVMRNEIFAERGYIFKTEKWIKYFNSKKWYKPSYEDVTDKLSVVERINIENLLKVTHLK